MRNIIEALFREVSEEEQQAAKVIGDFCQKNELLFPEQLMAIQYFSEIDYSLIISKINVLNTPLIPAAMFLQH